MNTRYAPPTSAAPSTKPRRNLRGSHEAARPANGAKRFVSAVAFTRELERLSVDPEELSSAIEAALTEGIIGPADTTFFEALLAGALGGRALSPEELAAAEPHALRDPGALAAVRVLPELPALFQGAGVHALAAGSTVVASPSAIDVQSSDGQRTFVHEITHVLDHVRAGTSTAVHYDVGTTPAEAAPRAAAARAPAPMTPEQRQAILRRYEGQLEEMRDRLTTGVFDWAVTDGDANAVYRILASAAPSERMVLIEDMQRRSPALIARLPDELPEATRRANPSPYMAVVGILGVQHRITELLSAAPATNGVTSEHGPAAAFMLSRMPRSVWTSMAQQRPVDTADPLTAWLAVVPEADRAPLEQLHRAAEAEQSGVRADREARAAQQSRLDTATDAALANDAMFSSSVQTLEELMSTSIVDWAVTDTEAIRALDFLEGAGSRLELYVHQLDRRNVLETLLQNVPEQERWGGHRLIFLRILELRNPTNNMQFVRQLLTTNFTDWAITDSEARLAFRIVRTMPADVQAEFHELDGGRWWNDMEGNLAREDTERRDATTYANVDERQRLMLDFEGGLLGYDADRLRSTVGMLLRMDQRDFVEATLRAHAGEIAARPDFQALNTEYGIAVGATPRDQARYDAWMTNASTATSDTNVLERTQAVGAAIGALLGGVNAWVWDQVGVNAPMETELDMQALAESARSVGIGTAGVTLGNRVAAEDNRLHLTADLHTGTLVARMTTLRIGSVNRISGGTTLQTGEITVRGASITAKWATSTSPETSLDLVIEGVEANDIWQTTSGQMRTARKVTLGTLTVRTNQPRTQRPNSTSEGMAQMSAELQETVNEVIGALRIDSTEPEAVAASLSQTNLGGHEAHIGLVSARIEGAATSSGDGAREVALTGLVVHATRHRLSAGIAARQNELNTEARSRALTPDETAELERLGTELAAAREREARLDALLERNRAGATLTPAEQEELRNLEAAVDERRVHLHVDSVTVAGGHSGASSVEALSLTGVDVHAATRDPDGGGAGASSGSMNVRLGGVSATNLVSGGSTRLERTEARVVELRAKIDARAASAEESALHETLAREVASVRRQMSERDAIRLRTVPPGGSPPARLAELDAQLADWERRTGASRVDHLTMATEGGRAAMSLSATTRGGQLSAAQLHTGAVTATGIHRDNMDVTSLNTHGLSVDTSAATDRTASLAERLGATEFSADSLAMTGLRMQRQEASRGLSDELAALRETEHLTPERMTEAHHARLAALPALITAARDGERRLTELRQRQSGGETLTPAERAEVEALSRRFDAGFREVDSLTMNNASGRFDAAAGEMTLRGEGSEAGPGFAMAGFRQGRTTGPGDAGRVVDRNVESVTARRMGLELQTGVGTSPADTTAMAADNADYSLRLGGEGVDVRGYREGVDGAPGSRRIDAIHADTMAMTYASRPQPEGGDPINGSFSMSATGATATGVSMHGASRVETLRSEIASLRATATAGHPLAASQEARIAAAEAELARYDAARNGIATARGSARRRLERQVREWESTSTTAVASAHADSLSMRADGVGNMMSESWDPAAGTVDVGMRMDGAFGVTGVDTASVRPDGTRDAGTHLDSFTGRDLRVAGHDVMSTDRRQLNATLGSGEIEGYRGGGTWARRGNIEGFSATIQGDRLDTHVDSATFSGAGSGGASAGRVSVRDLNASVTDFDDSIIEADGRTRHTSGTAAAVDITNGRHRGRSTDADTGAVTEATSRADAIHGRGATFSMNDASGTTFGLRSASGQGLSRTAMTTERDGAITTADSGLETFNGTGLSGSLGRNATTVRATHLDGTGARDSSSTLSAEARVMGHGPSTTERRVDRFSANGVYYSASTTPGLAESTTVSVHDASASGILNRTEDGSNGAVRETTIGSADTEGFMMGSRRTRPANVPGSAWTSSTIIGADRVTATDINHTGDLTEEVTTCGGPPAAIVGQRTAHVDRVDLRGATAWTDGHAMRAAWDGGEVQGGTLDETDLNGATTRSASLTEAGTGRGRVRVADMEHPDRAGTTMVVDGAHIDGLTYGDAETSADVQGLRADRIFAETTDSGMVAGATGVSGDSLYLDHRPRDPDAAGYSVSAEGIRNGSGHATFNRDPRGELGFATAHLEGVDADRLDYEYRSGTPDVSHDPSFMEQLADAHNITLDALNHAEGEITVRYPISGGVVGSLNIPVRNGTITPNDIIAALETQYFSIPASSRIGYFVPDWRVQTLTLLGEAPIPVASSAEVIQRIYHTISGQPPGTRHSTHGPAAAVSPWMDDLEILTNLRDVGGGAIELPGARFRVDPGARVTTSGTVGRDMTVGTEGLGIRGLETDDGTTRVGEVTTGSTETRMQGLSTLRPTYSGSIRDLHVGNVDYSAVGPLGSATEPRDRGAETAGYYSAEGASDRPQDLARYRDLPPDQVTSPVPDDEAAARRTRTRRW